MRGLLIILAALLSLPAALAPAIGGEIIVTVDRVVYPGQPVDMAGVREMVLRRRLSAGVGVVREFDELAGKVARRTILPNRPIPTNALRDPYLVEAGKPVRIYFRKHGVTIGMTGVALNSGLAGDVVRIRNMDSGKTVAGIVMADATIEVMSP